MDRTYREWLGLGGCHRDVLGGSIVEQVVTSMEAIKKRRDPPRGDDLQVSSQYRLLLGGVGPCLDSRLDSEKRQLFKRAL